MSSRRTFLTGLTSVAAIRAGTAPTPLQQKLSHQWQRPQFHLLPAANWMNDPNAPLYYRGLYHMFYQYNPNGAFWGTMHWGHATSKDLIHWKHQPVAMAPTPGGPDKDGVFSGCAVINNGTPSFLYTGVNPETQCLATSLDPQLNHWEKYSHNPVIAAPPAGLALTGFRDPAVWRERDQWYMALGAGRKGIGGMVLLYKSPDLIQWTYLHPLFEGPMDPQSKAKDVVGTGEMWECPDFFPIGNRHVLLISTKRLVYYWVGKYQDERFIPETEGVVDYGAYYAARTMIDAKGRRILWGWITEKRPVAEHKEAGWAGAMSLPRVLALNASHHLVSTPIPELATLRDDAVPVKPVRVAAGQEVPLPVYGTESAEFLLEFAAPQAEVGLRFSPARNPFEVAFDPSRQQIRCGKLQAPCSLAPGESLRIHLFRDGSVIELFVNDRVTLTGREYLPGLDTVAVYAKGAPAHLSKAQFWPINPISSDRLTT